MEPKRAPKLQDFVEGVFEQPRLWMPLAEVWEPANLEPDTVRTWILTLSDRLFTPVTGIARLANIAPSTLNRFVSGKSQNVNLNARTIELLKEAAKLEISRIIDRGDDTVNRSDIAEEITSISFRTKLAIQAGFFRACPIIPDSEALGITVPYREVFRNFVAAAHVVGSDLRHTYPDGSILFLKRIWFHSQIGAHGSHVVVLRRQEGGIETMLCEVVGDHKDRLWAQPLAQTTKMPEMMFIDQERDADGEIAVVGEVISSYRTAQRGT